MVERLAHRDLRNRSSEILRTVAAGGTFEITNHGKVVALLSPPAPDGSLRIRRASSARPFREIPRIRAAERTASALEALRDEG